MTVPSLMEWACPKQLRLRSIACRIVLSDSIRPSTVESRSFTGLRVKRLKKTAGYVLTACPIACIEHDVNYVIGWLLIMEPNAGPKTLLPAFI